MTIKELRLEKGLTRADFAERLGIDLSTLDDYESQMAKGLDPVFHESNIGLTNTDVWKDNPEDDTPADVGGDTGIRM